MKSRLLLLDHQLLLGEEMTTSQLRGRDLVLARTGPGRRQVWKNGVMILDYLNELIEDHHFQLILSSHQNENELEAALNRVATAASERKVPFPFVLAMAVCDSSKSENMKKLNIKWGMSVLVCREAGRGKVSLREAIYELGFDKNETVVFDGSRSAVNMARAEGCRAFHVGTQDRKIRLDRALWNLRNLLLQDEVGSSTRSEPQEALSYPAVFEAVSFPNVFDGFLLAPPVWKDARVLPSLEETKEKEKNKSNICDVLAHEVAYNHNIPLSPPFPGEEEVFASSSDLIEADINDVLVVDNLNIPQRADTSRPYLGLNTVHREVLAAACSPRTDRVEFQQPSSPFEKEEEDKTSSFELTEAQIFATTARMAEDSQHHALPRADTGFCSVDLNTAHEAVPYNHHYSINCFSGTSGGGYSSYGFFSPPPRSTQGSSLHTREGRFSAKYVEMQKAVETLQAEIASCWPYPYKDLKQRKVAFLEAVMEQYRKTKDMSASIAWVRTRDPLAYEEAVSGIISQRTFTLLNKR